MDKKKTKPKVAPRRKPGRPKNPDLLLPTPYETAMIREMKQNTQAVQHFQLEIKKNLNKVFTVLTLILYGLVGFGIYAIIKLIKGM